MSCQAICQVRLAFRLEDIFQVHVFDRAGETRPISWLQNEPGVIESSFKPSVICPSFICGEARYSVHETSRALRPTVIGSTTIPTSVLYSSSLPFGHPKSCSGEAWFGRFSLAPHSTFNFLCLILLSSPPTQDYFSDVLLSCTPSPNMINEAS